MSLVAVLVLGSLDATHIFNAIIDRCRTALKSKSVDLSLVVFLIWSLVKRPLQDNEMNKKGVRTVTDEKDKINSKLC